VAKLRRDPYTPVVTRHDAPPRGATTELDRLPRALGLTSSIALVVGITIGSGIFRSPAGIAERVPNPIVILTLWAGGGLVSLCGALSFAELAAALPETGGYYVYLREGWGRAVAFLFGWAQLVLIRASALGGLAIAFSDYALGALGIDPATHALASRGLAAAALVGAAAVNIIGLDLGAAVVSVSAAAKFLALAVLIVSALLAGSVGNAFLSGGPPLGPGSIGLALVSILWAYDGFADVSYAAGEVKQPQKTLPRAIILGTLTIIVVYVLTNLAYLSVIPVGQMARSPLVAADTMSAVVGARGATLVSLFVAVSAFGALNGLMLASPRLFFAMARDGMFFQPIARIHGRFLTPYVAILLAALLGVALVFSRSFEAMTSTFVIAIWPFYALAVGAVYRLRRLRPDLPRPYRTIGYPVVPGVFIAATVWFLVNALVSEPVSTGVTFALILAGLPIYYALFADGKGRR
jgi:basic amino acid/polyamine antiporter, APA family